MDHYAKKIKKLVMKTFFLVRRLHVPPWDQADYGLKMRSYIHYIFPFSSVILICVPHNKFTKYIIYMHKFSINITGIFPSSLEVYQCSLPVMLFTESPLFFLDAPAWAKNYLYEETITIRYTIL